jgi:HNH endonuclease
LQGNNVIKKIGWKSFVYEMVIEYCNLMQCRTFELKDFWIRNENIITKYSINNNYPYQKTCEMLQQLRNDGVLFFDDSKRGKYTLLKPEILDGELEENIVDFSSKLEINTKEYIREVYVRDLRLVREVKKRFDYKCIHPKCENYFLKDDGLPYIEVHHIIPLFENGEDDLDNLAVLCAHHHKMAHFSTSDTKLNLQHLYLDIING